MKNTGILIYLLPLVLMAGGCGTKFTSVELNEEKDMGLFIKGADILRFDEDVHKSGYNEQKNAFWVTDNSMANYFILECDAYPALGSTVSGNLVYTTADDTKTKSGISLEVTKYDEQSGKIWLWNQSGRIGIVVKFCKEP